MSAYSNMPWINAVREVGGKFEPVASNASDFRRGWRVRATIEPVAWPDNHYRDTHAVEKVMSRNAAEALADRLTKGYNR